MVQSRSPFAPDRFPDLAPVAGVRLGAVEAGLRYRGRPDLMLALLDPGTAAAGVFTRSRTASAPVDWCRRCLAGDGGGRARALVVNAGNANAFTGMSGVQAVAQTVEHAAALAGCAADEVYVASTGVIGEPLDVSGFADALADIERGLDGCAWHDGAQAIMTTDTYPKGAAATARIDGTPVAISGIAKGSGMIYPDMATLLGFLFTDARLPAPVLHSVLSQTVARTFNCITVDGDTSTSDTVMAFATGAGGAHDPVEDASDPRLDDFKARLGEVCLDLAHQIVRDGEGATKFVTVTVTGAQDDRAARVIAFAIANSPLVKTAIAGEDPNWGRIVMAVGKAGEAADRDRLAIWIGGQQVAERGERHPDYREPVAADHMRSTHIDIRADVGLADGHATVWTCDLSHGYVTINADYRS